ncbi:hypothetical protein GCM10011487_56980 [Steroidobacter agaridevorans]|uniref:Glycosyltransferase 2-like domain-containing protein n=2 Tax=Steroidobacter agaridevorans TaxID=2695856 RepID=A0A829YLW6_9GAMM|nr:hypothetical protein GCM10011487_56980 [Steroidobacter agaridevorans]
MLSQLTGECEVVVLDGASTDDTEEVVLAYARHCDRLRYIRQETNNGVDRDYDRAVELARGEYCWLMTDDDLLKPGAVSAVLNSLRRDLSLVLVNAEIRDFSLSTVLLSRWLDVESNRAYRSNDMDRLFVLAADFLKYIGGVVIKRALWLARDRQSFYGSWFIHVGVIFQEQLPSEVEVMAEPQIILRWGNAHTFSPKVMEILLVTWPSLSGRLAPSESAKGEVHSLAPWRHFRYLLELRSLGYYSLKEYRRWFRPKLLSAREKVAPILAGILPGVLANAIFVLYYLITADHLRELRLHDLRKCRYYPRNWGSTKPVW